MRSGASPRSRAAVALAALACVVALRPDANAQAVPPLARPPVADTPLARALSSAADAIEAARSANPLGAQRAYALDVRARQQAAAGDLSGAIATASLARAAALSPSASNGLAPARPFAAPNAGFAPIPLVNDGVVLPRGLLDARVAIERAGAGHESGLPLAKRYYRRALDAYLSGDLARALRDARVARTLARDSRSKGP